MAVSDSFVIFVILCNVSVFASIEKLTQSKVYSVNLNDTVEERWKHVMLDYKDFVSFSHKIISESVPPFALPLVEKIAAAVEKYLPWPYAGEIKGIAKALKMKVGDIVLINLFYDLTAYCTSIVAEDETGKLWHARNLDFDFHQILHELTIYVNFMQNGKILYSGVTFAGYIGLLTGQRPHSFTITVDERDKGSGWLNYLIGIFDSNVVPVSFLVRNVLERDTTFTRAVSSLSNTDTAADAYFIVAGVRAGEGAVITKARLQVDDVWYLNQTNNKWFLVETNYDHWIPTPASDKRRDAAIQSMRSMGRGHINTKNLFKVLSTPPVLQSSTIYSVVMSAADPQIFTTWLRGY
ncbi:N-acylethanolamine-hydrolyzing acid amidase-like [Gigantopelta aegis]|uniref:N-acylethanolamine-hydrolyzing acid amidase-like n=1 Tax=Gigantopelta aegis TaxID=1735272 RepID=UPI001B888F2E|nr:N-acylethanolamine-hydrolyzing acid amidase-like [Gigantopelta aegis]